MATDTAGISSSRKSSDDPILTAAREHAKTDNGATHRDFYDQMIDAGHAVARPFGMRVLERLVDVERQIELEASEISSGTSWYRPTVVDGWILGHNGLDTIRMKKGDVVLEAVYDPIGDETRILDLDGVLSAATSKRIVDVIEARWPKGLLL
jgi:hypothetical protein